MSAEAVAAKVIHFVFIWRVGYNLCGLICLIKFQKVYTEAKVLISCPNWNKEESMPRKNFASSQIHYGDTAMIRCSLLSKILMRVRTILKLTASCEFPLPKQSTRNEIFNQLLSGSLKSKS